MPRVSDDEVLLLWRALRAFRSGARHGQPDDRLATLTETMAETERRQAAWPCSALLDLLTPDLTRIGP
jgi:hypothetical protein